MPVSSTTKNHLLLWGIKAKKTTDNKPNVRQLSNIVRNETVNIWQLPYDDETLILLQTNFLKNLSACTLCKWENEPVSFCIKREKLFSLQYEKDENKYSLIDKRPKLRDYSVLGVLRILKATHKISKSQFQQSARTLRRGEGLRDSILQKVNMFLKNVREDKGYKHTQTTKPKNRIVANIDGVAYSVLLKTYVEKLKHDVSEKAKQEIAIKYGCDNQIIFS